MQKQVISVNAQSAPDNPEVIELTDNDNDLDYRLYTAGKDTPLLYGYGVEMRNKPF